MAGDYKQTQVDLAGSGPVGPMLVGELRLGGAAHPPGKLTAQERIDLLDEGRIDCPTPVRPVPVTQVETGEPMAYVSVKGGRPVTAELHSEIELFYARQMQLLDEGECDAWALTFAENGVFAANAYPEPVIGRTNIAAAASGARATLTQNGLRHRHWLGMLSVELGDGDDVRTRCYALVIETPLGGVPRLRHSTVCVDHLTRSGNGWMVRRRQVFRDDLH